MRSLVNKKNKDKRNQLILGIFLIIIMVSSTLGYALLGRSEDTGSSKIEYNGIEFKQDNSGYWYSDIQGYEFITQYNPEELENIEFISSLNVNNYQNQPLYFVGDIGQGSSEIIRNLAERFVLRIQEACINNESCEQDLPIKDCSTENIIIINEISEEEVENIYQEENCIFINSSSVNQTRYADKFLFNLMRI